jgi:hypothetical protein
MPANPRKKRVNEPIDTVHKKPLVISERQNFRACRNYFACWIKTEPHPVRARSIRKRQNKKDSNRVFTTWMFDASQRSIAAPFIEQAWQGISRQARRIPSMLLLKQTTSFCTAARGDPQTIPAKIS